MSNLIEAVAAGLQPWLLLLTVAPARAARKAQS